MTSTKPPPGGIVLTRAFDGGCPAHKFPALFRRDALLHNAPYGIRANCILPGLMDTPMAVDTRARASNRSRAEVAAERDARVPLRGKMGTGWDVANAALFLASDEANFIT
jgi:NAD(P)-dependent dehydrogenase (short-subunit alcohol dehydrogenase family)